jgi:RimJ/RimL family protein N-acetyltransferase
MRRIDWSDTPVSAGAGWLAHDALRAAGCTEAFLFTHEHNERALAVYVTAGYRPDGSSRKSEFHSTRCASCGW